jgi:hypothetical protein
MLVFDTSPQECITIFTCLHGSLGKNANRVNRPYLGVRPQTPRQSTRAACEALAVLGV